MKTIEPISVVVDPVRTAELKREFTQASERAQTYQVDLRVTPQTQHQNGRDFAEQLEQVNVNLATASAVVRSKPVGQPCDVCSKIVKKRHNYSVGPFEARICSRCKKVAEGAGLLLKFALSR